MKKVVLFITLAALSLTARSGIVDGEFRAGETGRSISLRSLAVMNRGWYAGNQSAPRFEFSNGTITLNNAQATFKPAIIGQLFTGSETGELALKFSVTVVDRNANLDFTVHLYGYKQRTAEKTILFSNAIKLESTEPPASGEYYEIKELAAYSNKRSGTLNNGDVSVLSVPFTAGTEYAFYGIRISANRPDSEDAISFSSISIAPAEKP